MKQAVRTCVMLLIVLSAIVSPVSAQDSSERSLAVMLTVVAYGLLPEDNDNGGCQIDLPSREPSQLTITPVPDGKKVVVPIENGEWREPNQTPLDRKGCLFVEPVTLPEADSYIFALDGTVLATQSYSQVKEASRSLYLGFRYSTRTDAIAAEMDVTQSVVLIPGAPTINSDRKVVRTPTPRPSPTPQPSPTPTPRATSEAGRQDDGTYVIHGTFTLRDNDGVNLISEDLCYGDLGYGDIAPGAQITVRNEADDLIGVAELEPGEGSTIRQCKYVFTVQVPKAKFYTFELGRRGGLTYSLDDMEDFGWQLEFELGE